MSNPRGDYFAALVRHETELWNFVERELAAAGATTLGRLKVLRCVAGAEVCRVQDVSDELGITVGAASRLVDRLEADGLVERTPNPADRRGSRIALLEGGRAAIARAEPLVESALATALGSIDESILLAATATLEKFGSDADR
jgi:DNA-binding MarR family transcriptional regulator